MKIVFFDCYSGVSGDMILGALLDLGLGREAWLRAVRRLAVSGFDVKLEETARQGMRAQRIIIQTEEQPERHFRQIKDLIEGSGLSNDITGKAVAVFRCLAQAEARIHGCSMDEVHFHEVGAVDAIVDVVGTCLALEMLEIGEIYSSPIGVGQGFAAAAHGVMPLPPPATLEILRGAPVRFTGIETELATPTGAAILKTLANFEAPGGNLSILRTGYGAGTKVIPQLPNVLRAILLERKADQEFDQATIIETNIDDMNPELYPHVIEKLLEAGAMDAYLVPLIMKKGRPGVLLSALCAPELRDRFLDVIYGETSTLGVRIQHVDRLKLPRREIVVETEFGPIKGKEARWKDRIRRTPEFEECRRIAREKHVPLVRVYQAFNRGCDEA